MKKLKVTYFFRKPRPQYFSIEKVFEQVINNLPDFVEPEIYKLKNGTTGWLGRVKALIEVRQSKGLINHITGDVTFIALALPRKGLVVTYHDLESLAQYKGWRFNILKFLWVTIPVKRAEVVTAISEHTKDQLIKWTNCEPDKIIVVPNPLPQEIIYNPKEFNSQNPTILIMGTKENKNVEGIFKAVGIVKEQGAGSKEQNTDCKSALTGFQSLVFSNQNVENNEKIEWITNPLQPNKKQENGTDYKSAQTMKLIVVGKMTERQKYLAEQYQLQIENLVHVPYDQIIDAYKRCDILCFPSFYEGFGLPIIEAQAIGKPVITSNFGAMKEVAGDGALLVCPNNINEISNALLQIIVDKDLRNDLVAKGIINAERFKAELISQKYAQLYEEMDKSLDL